MRWRIAYGYKKLLCGQSEIKRPFRIVCEAGLLVLSDISLYRKEASKQNQALPVKSLYFLINHSQYASTKVTDYRIVWVWLIVLQNATFLCNKIATDGLHNMHSYVTLSS